MARHRHPPAPGASPAARDPAAAEGGTVAHRTGAGHRPGQGLASSRYRAAVSGRDRAPGRDAGGPTVTASPACRGWGCAAVPVMARGPGRRPGRRPDAGDSARRRPRSLAAGSPGSASPAARTAWGARAVPVPASARQPADAPRGDRGRQSGPRYREPAVTAGTVPTGRPSSCRAWEPGRGRRICGRTPVTREESHAVMPLPPQRRHMVNGCSHSDTRYTANQAAASPITASHSVTRPRACAAEACRLAADASARWCSVATFAVTIGKTPLPYPGGLVTTKDRDAASRAQWSGYGHLSWPYKRHPG